MRGLSHLSTFSASYYHKVSEYVEVGAKAEHKAKSKNGDVALEFGTKITLEANTTGKLKNSNPIIKLKGNTAGIFSASYTQPFRSGVKATFGLELDTKRLQRASARTVSHKIGAAFVFNS